MAQELQKLSDTIHHGPGGALVGAAIGYLVSKNLGYDKTVSVISFTMVGLIIGASIGFKLKGK